MSIRTLSNRLRRALRDTDRGTRYVITTRRNLVAARTGIEVVERLDADHRRSVDDVRALAREVFDQVLACYADVPSYEGHDQWAHGVIEGIARSFGVERDQ